MADNYGALCSDFFINQRLDVKMDLPTNRETVLGMFDRLRRDHPAMERFRKTSAELVLESEPADGHQQWAALRKTSIRTGVVNPRMLKSAYAFHRLALEIAPYFLSISPLDVDYLELMFGFDMLATGNHDAIVHEALLADSPLGRIFDGPGVRYTDCRPLCGAALTEQADIQAMFEVKTRTPGGPGSPAWKGESTDLPPEPISVYLTLRRFGAVKDITDLTGHLATLAAEGERLVQARVVPHLLVPIRDAIASSNAG